MRHDLQSPELPVLVLVPVIRWHRVARMLVGGAVAAVLSLTAGACAVPAAEDDDPSSHGDEVVGGTVDATSYRSAGYLAIHVEASEWDEARTSAPVCGATLIGPSLAITAAHCLSGYTRYDAGVRGSFWVGFGAAPLLEPSDPASKPAVDEARLRATAFPVEWFASHPRFDQTPESAGRFDIAILRLAKPVPASVATPAKIRFELPTFAPSGSCAGPDARAPYTFVGYGRGNAGRISDPADATFGIRKTLPQCFERGERWDDLTWSATPEESADNFLVSRYFGRSASPEAGHCRGDSGGAAFVAKKTPDEPDELVALLSQMRFERDQSGELLPDCRPQSGVSMVGFDDGDGTLAARPRVFIEESAREAQVATPHGERVTVSGAFLGEYERCPTALGRPLGPVSFELLDGLEGGKRHTFVQRFEKAMLGISWRGQAWWATADGTPIDPPACP